MKNILKSMIKIPILKKNIYDYLFGLLIIILPFSKSLPNIIMGFLFLIFIINFKKQDFKKPYKSPYFFLFLLVVYIILKAIINNSFIEDIDFYKKYFYLILIPLLFIKVKNLQLLKISAIITINATIIISLFKIVHFYHHFNFIPFADGWATNAVLILERPYAGIFCVIGVILSFDQILLKTKRKYLFVLSFILCAFFIFFISIRISIITLLILFLLYSIFYYKVTWKKKILFATGIFLMFASIFFLNKNIMKRFFIDGSLNKAVQTTKQFEPRVIIWSCAEEITHQNDFSMLFGTISYSNIKKSLVDCYSVSLTNNSRRIWFVETSYNTHSQFIDFYLIGGLTAIFLFAFFLIKYVFLNRKDFCSVAMILSFILILCIENVFHRQFGCFIFTIFTAMYLNNNYNLSKNDQD